MFGNPFKLRVPTEAEALPGRTARMTVPERHAVLGTPLDGAIPGTEVALFGMGCFWGAERKFWQAPGVVSTAVGYAAGYTPNPTYEEVCTGLPGHNEVVRVVYDPKRVSYADLLKVFWESGDGSRRHPAGPRVGRQVGEDPGAALDAAVGVLHAAAGRKMPDDLAVSVAEQVAAAELGADDEAAGD